MASKSFMIRGWGADMVEVQVASELEKELEVRVVEVRLFRARTEGGNQSAMITVEDSETVRD